jgi:hypothetical protein
MNRRTRTAPDAAPASSVEQQVTVDGGIFRPPSTVTEHAKLSAGTADLWRELVHLCMETPCNP